MPERQRPVRVAVLNDHAVVVAGVAGLLRPYPEIQVVQRVSGGPVTVRADLVLYDTFAQVQGQGLDVPGAVAASGGKLVVYSWNTDPDLVAQSLAAGAVGYLSKALDGAGLRDALVRIARGEHVVPDQAGVEARERSMSEPGRCPGRWPGREHGLSAREAEVLTLLCEGLSNREIGERAFIGVNTVKTHLRQVFAKIGVDTRGKAALWGLEHGFGQDRWRRDR